ncbi:MAG: glycosyltransferase family 2 protein [Patescibacteria group bacterium]|nr:glycosyltransferase family 2 protein [Patescibacteria group bacterium]
MDLSIILLSFNTRQLLDECLASIYDNTKNISFEVIVVDNASVDQSREMIKRKYPEVLMIANRTNLGYSAGNNLGIKKAQGRYLLFLNSDTQTVGNALKVMVEFSDNHPEFGILGPKIVNPDKTPQRSIGSFYSLPRVVLAMLGLERLGFGRKTQEEIGQVDWVCGAAIMVKREVFNKIGLWDENLFMYMEEVELCYRAKKNSITTAFLPEAVIVHKERGSSKEGKKGAVINIYKGLLYFYKLYRPVREYNFLRFVLKTKALILENTGRITGNTYLYKTYGQALELFQ